MIPTEIVKRNVLSFLPKVTVSPKTKVQIEHDKEDQRKVEQLFKVRRRVLLIRSPHGQNQTNSLQRVNNNPEEPERVGEVDLGQSLSHALHLLIFFIIKVVKGDDADCQQDQHSADGRHDLELLEIWDHSNKEAEEERDQQVRVLAVEAEPVALSFAEEIGQELADEQICADENAELGDEKENQDGELAEVAPDVESEALVVGLDVAHVVGNLENAPHSVVNEEGRDNCVDQSKARADQLEAVG